MRTESQRLDQLEEIGRFCSVGFFVYFDRKSETVIQRAGYDFCPCDLEKSVSVKKGCGLEAQAEIIHKVIRF